MPLTRKRPYQTKTIHQNKPFAAWRSGAALLCVMLVALPGTGHAYIGPGLGVAAIWVLLGPLAAIIILIAIIAYYPLRYYYKKYFQYRGPDGDKNSTPDDNSNRDDNSHSDV